MRSIPMHGSLAHPLTERQRHLLTGVWRLVDPKIALASAVPFVAGIALAIDQVEVVAWGLALAAYVAVFLVEVGKNAVNDLCDFETDRLVTDEERSPFSGGKRTLVDGLLTRRDLTVITWIAFAIAGMIGLEVASRSRASLLLIGAGAAIISVVYAMPPVKLASRGLGELAVGIVYGPGIVLGTSLLLGDGITTEAVIASVTLGLLIANVLLINEIPDERADRAAGKRTLVVRLGRDHAQTLIALVFANAFAIPIIAAAYGATPFRVSALIAGVPVAVFASVMLQRTRGGPPVVAQAATLATYVVTGVAFSCAVLLG